MKGLWIVLLAVSFVLPLFARFKRTLAETGDTAGDTARTAGDESTDDGFFDFDNVESEEAVGQPQPYFTYEAPEAEVAPKTVRRQAPSVHKPVQQEAPVYEPAFDLRQAVIYQTILNNKYINAENQ